MRTALRAALAFVATLAGIAGAQVTPLPYALPPWEAAEKSTEVRRYATQDEYAAALSDARFMFEKVTYASGGLRVVAYVYRPKAAGPRPVPVVVYNRGSFTRKDIAPELLALFHRLAAEGFAVVAPLYRGSDGGEGRDEMGGAELDDLKNIGAVLDAYPALDRRNVFLYGESRGGMMVFQALRDGFPARAAATFGAFTDLDAMTAAGQGQAMARSIWPDFDARRAEIVERRSAIRWADKLTVPLLLMHGGGDRQVPVAQAEEFATLLANGKHAPETWIVPGANHLMHEQRVERDRRAAAFFRRHLASTEASAEALAQRMLDALGGREAWAAARNTVNDSQQNWDGDPSVLRVVITMDFERYRMRIETRGEGLHLIRVIDGDRHWRLTREGTIAPVSDETLAIDRRFYAGHVYRTLHRIAKRDPALSFAVGKDGRLEVLEGGKRIAWYLLDRAGQPYRYGAHEDEEGGIFGPWDASESGIRHPVWVTRDGGKWRAMLKRLEVNVPLGGRFDPPEGPSVRNPP